MSTHNVLSKFISNGSCNGRRSMNAARKTPYSLCELIRVNLKSVKMLDAQANMNNITFNKFRF